MKNLFLFFMAIIVSSMVAFTSCQTSSEATSAGGTSAGKGSSTVWGGLQPESPQAVALAQLKTLNRSGGRGWSVSSSADGSVYVQSAPYVLISGGPAYMGMEFIFEGDASQTSASFMQGEIQNLLSGASTALSADGSLLVVGAPGVEPGDPSYVLGYLKEGQSWADSKEEFYPIYFRFPAMEDGWLWGMDVDLSGESGTTVVMGAPGAESYGQVWYILQPSEGWTTDAEDFRTGYLGAPPSLAQPGDEFGQSVAISRDDTTIVVGAPGVSEKTGAVYFFKKPADGWLKTETVYPITSIEGNPGDRTGESVAVSNDGSVIAVGAPGAEGGKGLVYVITEFDPANESHNLYRLAGNQNHRSFGISIDISGDGNTIAAGSFGVENSGGVRVYKSAAGTWEDATLTHEWSGNPEKEGQAGAMFGFSLDLTDDGQNLLVGIPLFGGGQGDALWFDTSE